MQKTIEILEPHRKQYDFLKSKAKFRAFIGGVGSGKTKIGVAEMLTYALANPKSLNAITAPTYPMLRDATQRTFFEICPEQLIVEFNRGRNEVMLTNGSEILFRSCDDPDRLRGPNLAAFHMDEAALCAGLAWKIMQGRLRQAGFEQKAWITSTPKGFNWIYEEFVEKRRDNYEIIYCSTEENPFLPTDFVPTLKESYTGVFAKQEIMGEFVGFEGLVYPAFSRQVHVVNCQDKEFSSIIYGVDWGYTNPMVCLVIGLDADDRVYILDEIYEKHLLIEDFAMLVKSMQNKYGKGEIYPDPSEPQFIQKFIAEDLDCVGSNNEVVPGIQKVSSKIDVKNDGRAALYIDPKCVHTISEFENYRYAETKEGRPQQENPLKVFDHAMDALRYAVSSIDRADEYAPLESLGKFMQDSYDGKLL